MTLLIELSVPPHQRHVAQRDNGNARARYGYGDIDLRHEGFGSFKHGWTIA